MKCPKCQADNREGAGFCGKCGNKLEVLCPQCNSINPPDNRFCDKCGHELTRLEEALPIDYSQPQSYTPKFLADKILQTRSLIEGERKLVTVLFADVANFTSMSEKLDPEEVHQIMDGCYQVLMDEIHRYEGTIDKFTGDGVMALFGAPVAHEDHAQRACYAALAMQRAMGEYSERLRKDYGVEFKMRVGLNSGLVIVGAVGNDLRMDYTAIGDTTNIASRMQGMAKPGTILVSDDSHMITRAFFRFKPLGKVKVKGKEFPLEAYELIEAGKVETRIGAALARGLTKFVGRKREIGALKEAFEKAMSGSGQVVGIVGEPGVGKSRILLELRGMLPKEEYTYLEGRCLHYGSSMPYLPFLDILRAYFDIKEGEREFVIKKKMADKVIQLDEKLDDILPPLHDILSLKIDDEEYLKLDPQQKRERIFEAIRDLFILVSENKPLILAVEDLHWVDKTSEEFLDYLIGSLTGTQILLVLLYRPEYTHQWASKSYYSQMGVEQLSTSASAKLVQAIFEGGVVVHELRELILNRAAGNPLFIEEFTHTMLENGTIKKKDVQYMLSMKASDVQIPNTIQGIIAARMDRLENNLKRTMQMASVIGRDFTYRILQTIAGIGEELKSYLINLQGLEFIYEKSLFPELEYIFKHALTQEVAYNSLLLKKRKEIHEKIGKAIEELYPDKLEEFYEVVAHHYSRSNNSDKAYQYLKLSADKAKRSYSNWEAFRFYKGAINILNKLSENEENKREGIEVRLSIEGIMRLLAYPEDSLQILQEGERLSKELGDERSLATFYSSKSLYYSFKGDSHQGIEYAEKCFKEAEKIQDIDLMAPTAFDLCSAYSIAGEFYKLVELAPRVINLLEKTHRESDDFGVAFNFSLYSAFLVYWGNAMGWLGNFEEGEALCEKGLHFAHQIDNLYSIGFAEGLYGELYLIKGDGKNAIGHLLNAVKYSEEGQIITLLGIAWNMLGWGYYLLGDLEIARKNALKGLQIHHNAGIPFLLPQMYFVLTMCNFDLGELENAHSIAEEAVKLAHNNNERDIEGIARASLGRILLRVDPSQSVKAEECILQGIELMEELKLKPLYSQGYLYLGELYADTGQKEKAFETLKMAEGAFQEMGMDYWLRRTQEVLENLQGQ